MSQQDLFNLSNVFEDERHQQDGRLIIGVIIRVILALSTAGYFFVWGADLFSWLAGASLAPWISAAVGAFFVDGMAWYWAKLRLSGDAGTNGQLAIAKIMSIVDMSLSVVITFVFAMLIADFVVVSAEWLPVIRAVGFIVGIGAIVANAGAWHYYESSGAAAREALQRANLRAMQNAGQHEINKAQSVMVIERTLRDVQKSLPQHADQAAAENSGRFFTRRFTRPKAKSGANGRK